jgi:hypothetical protein
MMDRRRLLLTSLAGALAAPLAVEAQQAGKVPRAFFTTKMPGPQVAEGFDSDRSLAPLQSLEFVSGWLHWIPRGHQVDLECLDPTAWPENGSDDPHVLVSSKSVVVALTDAVKVDGNSRAVVGRCQRHQLAAKVNPNDPAFDDQRRLPYGRRLGCRLRRKQEQTDDGDARNPRQAAHSHHPLVFKLYRIIVGSARRAGQDRCSPFSVHLCRRCLDRLDSARASSQTS